MLSSFIWGKLTKLELFFLNLSKMKIRFYELCKLHKISEKQILNFSFNKKDCNNLFTNLFTCYMCYIPYTTGVADFRQGDVGRSPQTRQLHGRTECKIATAICNGV